MINYIEYEIKPKDYFLVYFGFVLFCFSLPIFILKELSEIKSNKQFMFSAGKDISGNYLKKG